MTNECQKNDLIIAYKKGIPVYAANPSIPDAGAITRKKPVRVGDNKKGFIADKSSGEVISIGGMGFYEYEEVDTTKFIKLFAGGFRTTKNLSKAGTMILELVYQEVLNTPNADQIQLSFYSVSQKIPAISERTYQRGIRDLVDRELLFKSHCEGAFFINVNYIFNGDRLGFIKGYKRNKALDLDTPLALETVNE